MNNTFVDQLPLHRFVGVHQHALSCRLDYVLLEQQRVLLQQRLVDVRQKLRRRNRADSRGLRGGFTVNGSVCCNTEINIQ